MMKILSTKNHNRLLLTTFFAFGIPFSVFADDSSRDSRAQLDTLALADMGIADLIEVNVEITSAGRKPQAVSNAAAAVFVLTSEDIRRSGVTTLAEALRMVPGIIVSRINGYTWSINSRGTTGKFSNKLLVMIDGRSIYEQNTGNVYWQVHDVVLEDIERIEVVRGPGGSLWGANAVNGVVNIITKQAGKTQGILASGGGGTEERGFATARYGGEFGDGGFYRVYAKYTNRDDNVGLNGAEADDAQHNSQAGFRMDKEVDDDIFTLQGDAYQEEYSGNVGRPAAIPVPPFSVVDIRDGIRSGANILGRWTHKLAEDSELIFQTFYDYKGGSEDIIRARSHILDFDFQHRFQANDRNEIVWGAGYRSLDDHYQGRRSLLFDPEKKKLDLYTAFIADEIKVYRDELRFVLGTKFEHDYFVGSQWSPTARVLYAPSSSHTLWSAVSRAVRTPARTETGAVFLQQAFPGEQGVPTLVTLFGNRDYDAEVLVAYETGYRTTITPKLNFDLSLFFNDYSDIQTLEQGSPILNFDEFGRPSVTVPIRAGNMADAEAFGFETAITWKPKNWWQSILSYSFVDVDVQYDPDSRDVNRNSPVEEKLPRNQAQLRNMFDVGENWEVDSIVRFTDSISALNVKSYFDADARLGYRITPKLSLSLVGQNLLHQKRLQLNSPDFIAFDPVGIERGVYLKLTYKD